MKKTLVIILGSILTVIILIALAGMYKFNYLASLPGYDVDGNKIKIFAEISVCDENGRRYKNAQAAIDSGLEMSQFGATFCSDYKMHPTWDRDGDNLNDCEKDGTCDHTIDYSQPAPVSDDFLGLSLTEAEALAVKKSVPFRVIEKDGVGLATTMDYRVGRINATIKNNIVTAYQVEGSEDTIPLPADKYDMNSWKKIILDTCRSYFDGCNTCRRNKGDTLSACTRKFCEKYEQPRCLK